MRACSHLLDLPTELITRCLSFVSGLDLLSCRLTNRLLRSIIQHSTLLQYTIELTGAHAENNPSCALPVVQKLQRLRQRQDAWLTLDVHKIRRVDVTHKPSGVYDFSGGVYVLGESQQDGSRPTKCLKYIRLPSLEDEGEGEIPWHTINVRDDIVDFGLAVQEHDLIAVVTERTSTAMPHQARDIFIELLQFSTAKPHPRAAHPLIPVVHNLEAFGYASISIEIVGPVLALLLTFPFSPTTEDRLFVYNWQTGERTIVHTARSMTYTAFACLSPTSLVLPNLENGTLELCDLSTHGNLNIVAILALPGLRHSCYIARVACRGEPNPIPSSPPQSADSAPFHDRAGDAIIIFNLLIQEGVMVDGLVSVSFVVRRSALLAYCALDADGAREWGEWGPWTTRWFDSNEVVTRWITTTSGARYVSIAEEVPSRISVMDFGEYAVGRVRAVEGVRAQVEAGRRRLVKSRYGGWVGADMDGVVGVTSGSGLPFDKEEERWEDKEDKRRVRRGMVPVRVGGGKVVWLNDVESVLSPELGVFQEEVRSSLPYVETLSGMQCLYDAVLMDESRIVGMNMDEMNDKVKTLDIMFMG